MKITNTKGSSANTSNPLSHFTIEMDVKGLTLFLTMALATALLIFYLGLLMGKSERDPNAPSPDRPALSQGQDAGFKEPQIAKQDLTVLADRDKSQPAQGLNALKRDFTDLNQRADQLIKAGEKAALRAEQTQLKPQPVKAKPLKQTPKVVKETKKKVSSPKTVAQGAPWPAVSPPKVIGKGLYTIQVMATKNKTKAQAIIRQLRKRGYNAYIAEILVGSERIYRVRVGKASKNKILPLRSKVGKIVKGLGKLQIVKID